MPPPPKSIDDWIAVRCAEAANAVVRLNAKLAGIKNPPARTTHFMKLFREIIRESRGEELRRASPAALRHREACVLACRSRRATEEPHT